MRLLILGGTLFLGRDVVDCAQGRGHELTLFNRGQTDPGAFADVEQITGDRELALHSLAGRSWDAVIDTSGYVPRVVRASAGALADAVDHYVFVSSISAYASLPVPGLYEDAPLAELPDPDSEDVARYYGELKVGCEREVREALPDRALWNGPG